MIKKTTQLKRMLVSDQTEFIMEAHSGLERENRRRGWFQGHLGKRSLNFCSHGSS